MMSMSRGFRMVLAGVILCAGVAAGGLAAACGGAEGGGGGAASPGGPSGELRILGYEDVTNPKYIAGFKKRYPDVKIRISAYEDGDQALAKLRAGFECDVINWCVDEPASRMALKLGYLQPLDIGRIHDWNRIFPAFYDLPLVTEPDGQHYLVPTEAGITGIVYNTKYVKQKPNSWRALFDPKYKGRALMMDFPATSVQVGALALGYKDSLNLDDQALARVKQLYLDAKARGQFRTFYSNDSEIIDLMHSGEVVIGVGYPDNAERLRELGDSVEFATAREGVLLWAGGYAISSACRNPDAAYALLNYYLSPEAEKFEAEHWGYYVANRDTLDVVSAQERARLAEAENWTNLRLAGPPLEGYDRWVRVWQEVKRQ